jgi:hypothetical protein
MAAVGGGIAVVPQEADVLELRYASFVSAGGTVQLGLNVRHYRVRGVPAGSTVTLGDCVSRINTLHSTLYRAILAPGAVFIGLGLRRIRPAPPTQDAVEKVSTGPGTLPAGDLLAKQTSGVISLKTGFAGRAFRGRMFLPFPSEAINTANGAPDVVYKTAVDVLAVQVKATVVVTSGTFTINLVPVIYHRGTHTVTDVTDALTSPLWGTQRRRGDYGRVNNLPF